VEWCAYVDVDFYIIVGSVFAFGSLVFVIYPLSAAHANDWCGQDKMMQTSSGLLLGYGCGAILGPMLSSALMDRFGPAALFIFIGVCCLMLYCLWQSWSGGHNRKKISFVAHPCDHASVDTLYQQDQVDSKTELP